MAKSGTKENSEVLAELSGSEFLNCLPFSIRDDLLLWSIQKQFLSNANKFGLNKVKTITKKKKENKAELEQKKAGYKADQEQKKVNNEGKLEKEKK